MQTGDGERGCATKHFARTLSHLLFAFIYLLLWRWTRYCFFWRTFALFRIWSESGGCLDAECARSDFVRDALFAAYPLVAHFPPAAKWCVTGGGAAAAQIRGAHAVMSEQCTFHAYTTFWSILSSSLTEDWGARVRKNCVVYLHLTPAVSTQEAESAAGIIWKRLTGATKPDFDLTVSGRRAKNFICIYRWPYIEVSAGVIEFGLGSNACLNSYVFCVWSFFHCSGNWHVLKKQQSYKDKILIWCLVERTWDPVGVLKHNTLELLK